MKLARTRLVAAVVAAAIGIAVAVAAPILLFEREGGSAPPASVRAQGPLPPPTLRETGLYADWDAKIVAAENRPFTPQYPLWTDGATKRRWIRLPPGTAIDGANPDAWQFPVGTRVWKEFAFGRRAETRYMELTDAGWIYATYAWSEDEREAPLAPPGGAASAEIAPGLRHFIPSHADCRACHANGPTPILGFSALQLSSDRDPNAVHREAVPPGAIDLGTLVADGELRDFPAQLVATPPRIPARTPTERAALGYLHGNCGGCHRRGGAVDALDMFLAQSADPDAPHDAIATTIGRTSTFAPAGVTDPIRIVAGDPDHSVLLERVRSRVAVGQMPPLGTRVVDEDAARLLASWIDELAY